VFVCAVVQDRDEAVALANGTDYGLEPRVDAGHGRGGSGWAHSVKAGEVYIRTLREEGQTRVAC